VVVKGDVVAGVVELREGIREVLRLGDGR